MQEPKDPIQQEPDEILDDLKQVIDTRVTDFTPEEKVIADRITPNIRAMLRIEVRKELETVLTKRQDNFNEELRTATLKLTQENFELWKKEQEPLRPEEISAMLTQEYVEFPVKIREGGKVGKIREFVITELVEEKETKLVRLFSKHLVPNLQKLSEIQWQDLGSQAERIEALLNVIPDFLSAMAEAVAVCLDPYGEEDDVNAEWVKKNIPSRRMIGIIIAQADCNRYRDFLSDGFRMLKMFRTTSTSQVSQQ